MRTHYEPFSWDEDAPPETAMCGTTLGEKSEVTARWREVTCIKCLNSREGIDKAVERDSEAISEQLGDMALFMKNQVTSHDNQ